MRELGSLRRAVEKPDAERMFEVADGLGDDRVRDRQAIGGARHAAGLGDGQDDVQVAQLQPAAYSVGPLHATLL